MVEPQSTFSGPCLCPIVGQTKTSSISSGYMNALDQGSAKGSLWAKSNPLPVFVINVYWYHFVIDVYWYHIYPFVFILSVAIFLLQSHSLLDATETYIRLAKLKLFNLQPFTGTVCWPLHYRNKTKPTSRRPWEGPPTIAEHRCMPFLL